MKCHHMWFWLIIKLVRITLLYGSSMSTVTLGYVLIPIGRAFVLERNDKHDLEGNPLIQYRIPAFLSIPLDIMFNVAS